MEGIRLCHLLYLNDKKWNGKILNYYNNAIFGIKNEKKIMIEKDNLNYIGVNLIDI